jgi:hypothetical protein
MTLVLAAKSRVFGSAVESLRTSTSGLGTRYEGSSVNLAAGERQVAAQNRTFLCTGWSSRYDPKRSVTFHEMDIRHWGNPLPTSLRGWNP